MYYPSREAFDTRQYAFDRAYDDYRRSKEKQYEASLKAMEEQKSQQYYSNIPLSKLAEEFDGPLRDALILLDHISKLGPNPDAKTLADEILKDKALAERIFGRNYNATYY